MTAIVFKMDHTRSAAINIAANFLRARPQDCARPGEALRVCRCGWGLSVDEAMMAVSDLRAAGIP